jgi:2-phosphoglycerate kinase
MNKIFYLIGGAPTTGKSTVAKLLAKELSLPWISTDQLREIVKPYGDKNRFPTLYDTANLTAEEFLSMYSAEQIAEMGFKQGDDVWPAVKGLLNNKSDWQRGGIVEGVNILPHLVAEENYVNKEKVKPIFLVDLDRERMTQVVYTRGLYDDADKYSDDVKDTEVEWAMIFAQRLKKEAEKYGFPCVEISKTESDIDAIMRVLKIPDPKI